MNQPDFSIEKEILWHVINNILRKFESTSCAREHRLFQRIPKASNAIIFLKYPPSVMSEREREREREREKEREREREREYLPICWVYLASDIKTRINGFPNIFDFFDLFAEKFSRRSVVDICHVIQFCNLSDYIRAMPFDCRCKTFWGK